MLQIVSGKLFTCEPAQRNRLRGVLYTNLRLDREVSIETRAGSLLATGNLRDTKTAIYEVTELIEDRPGPGVIASHGIEPYLNEFAAVTSFGFNVLCTPDRELALRLMGERNTLTVSDPPKKFIRGFFESEVWSTPEDSKRFIAFVNALLGLNRKAYLSAIRAIKTYTTGLHRIADDLELAYTLLVASIESLVQGFDGHRAEWDDYDPAKRTLLDEALSGADEAIAANVRKALLEIEHVSLRRRFKAYSLDHVSSRYFREEAAAQESPIGRSELGSALIEAYNLRSSYIHNLQPLPRLLTYPYSFTEVVRIDRAPYLTFQGLARLARTLILEFVDRQPKVEKEPYNYQMERPGVVQVPLSPEYWVGRSENLSPQAGRRKLEGFLEQLAGLLQKVPQAKITDMREVLRAADFLARSMRSEDRLPFLAIYHLFNPLLPAADRLKLEHLDNFAQRLESPSVEGMIVELLLGNFGTWELQEQEAMFKRYFRERDWKNGLRIPAIMEAGLALALAERHRSSGDVERARELIASAVDNYPAHSGLRNFEVGFATNEVINWEDVLSGADQNAAN